MNTESDAESDLAREGAKRLENASGADPRVERMNFGAPTMKLGLHRIMNGTAASRLRVQEADSPIGEGQ